MFGAAQAPAANCTLLVNQDRRDVQPATHGARRRHSIDEYATLRT
jgi:hypothetical protein